MKRKILHCDMNNCYASIEEMKNPSLKNKIMVVGGSEDDRHGIVLAKNRHAKALGIKTGETLFEARIKAPNLIVVPPHFEDYLAVSKKARLIYYDFTNKVESFGLDECFLDITGSSKFGSDTEIASKIRERMKSEIGITISVGVSDNKCFAKLASDIASYDETLVMKSEDMKTLIWPIKAKAICGIGRKTAEKLHILNIETIGDLANAEPNILKKRLGINGVKLWNMANGRDDREVADFNDRDEIKTVGNGTTFRTDLRTFEDVKMSIFTLAIKVANRLKNYKKLCSGVEIAVKNTKFESQIYQRKNDLKTDMALEIYRESLALFKDKYRWNYGIRAMTIRAIYLEDNIGVLEPNFFCDYKKRLKLFKVDRVMYEINKKYSSEKITLLRAKLPTKFPIEAHDIITLPTGYLRTPTVYDSKNF